TAWVPPAAGSTLARQRGVPPFGLGPVRPPPPLGRGRVRPCGRRGRGARRRGAPPPPPATPPPPPPRPPPPSRPPPRVSPTPTPPGGTSCRCSASSNRGASSPSTVDICPNNAYASSEAMALHWRRAGVVMALFVVKLTARCQ